MRNLAQKTATDKTQASKIIGATRVYWGSGDEIYQCGGVKLPDLVRTRGKVGERLAIDPALILAFQMEAILVIPVIHLDAPRRQPMTGYLHLLDLLKHGTLHYADDGTPWLEFPSAIIKYPEKKTTRRCNARRPKGA